MRTVLYVCTGNTCRSPMAEAIARHQLAAGSGDGQDLFVASAGVAALEGIPASPETVAALAGLGIEHDGRSKPLNAEMIRQAELVLCMTDGHVESARELVAGEGEHEEKIQRLDPDGDIPDPIGHGQSAYDQLAKLLMDLIPQRLRTLV